MTEVKQFRLLPPRDPTACKICGRNHLPDKPHDAQQLHYQYHFYFQHGRWPTWKDAIAHCDKATRADWEDALKSRGAWTEPDKTQ